MTMSNEVEWEGNLLQAYADLKKVPLTKVLRNAGRDFVQTALSICPITPHKKSIWALAPPKGKSERTNHIFLDTADDTKIASLRKHRLMVPMLRGAAKSSWQGAFRALGMGNRAYVSKHPTSAVSSAGWSGEDESGDVCLTIRDNVNWVMASHSGTNNKILEAGMSLASERIIRDWHRCLDYTWRSGKLPSDVM